MRKSQWKQVPEDPQEKNGEQERPAMTVEDLRKIFEPQKTNRPQRKSDDRGKVFEVQDQIGTGCKSHVLHLGVDQNRNIPNQDILGNKLEPQERSEKTPVKSEDPQGKNETHWTSYGEQGRPAMTVGDLRKIYEPQKTNRPQRKSEKYEQEKEELQHKLAHTLDRSEHLPVTVDDICEKFDKYEEEKEELQHKFDDLQKTCEYTLGRREQLFSATVDNICEKLDKYEEEKEDLQHKFDDLQKKWAHIPDRMDKLSATVDDICEKLDKCEHDKEELQHKFDDLQKKCVGNTLDIREQLSATVDDIWGKFEEHQRKFEYSLSKKEQSSSTHEELQHQFEELQHQFERPQKIFDKKEQGKEDLPQKIEELQKKLDKYKQEKEELQKKSEDLQKEIDRRKAQFKLGWRESTLYPDWRKEEFQAGKIWT